MHNGKLENWIVKNQDNNKAALSPAGTSVADMNKDVTIKRRMKDEVDVVANRNVHSNITVGDMSKEKNIELNAESLDVRTNQQTISPLVDLLLNLYVHYASVRMKANG